MIVKCVLWFLTQSHNLFKYMYQSSHPVNYYYRYWLIDHSIPTHGTDKNHSGTFAVQWKKWRALLSLSSIQSVLMKTLILSPAPNHIICCQKSMAIKFNWQLVELVWLTWKWSCHGPGEKQNKKNPVV